MVAFEKLVRVYRRSGALGLLNAFLLRLRPFRSSVLPLIKAAIHRGRGLEIGGPSQFFSARGILPVYPFIESLDNCNFGQVTLWEGEIEVGSTFQFNKKKSAGLQYILEASNLAAIDDCSYDFVLSSHVLEHCANPLKVLHEWSRVLRENGTLLIVLPHKDGTFDHRRPVTELYHLIDDHKLDVTEEDETHFDEIFRLHDLGRDAEAGGRAKFLARVRNNAVERGVHHHVFDTGAGLALVDHAGFQILAVESVLPFHIICLAQKVQTGSVKDNAPLFGANASWRAKSPFETDNRI